MVERDNKGKFIRGHKGYGKGSPRSKEVKEKLRLKLLNHSVSKKTREKLSKAHKGKKLSIETREKMSNHRKGKNFEELYGKEKALEIKRKISKYHKNKKTPLNQIKRHSKIMKLKFKKGEISIWNKGKTWEEIYGKERAEQMKKKWGEKYIGRKFSEEHIKKIVEARKKNGYIISEETKRKISESEKGKKVSSQIKKNLEEWRKKNILPLKDTSIEVKIQNYLKQLGYEFFTHQYMKEIKHGYQCDILIPTLNLVIECDGNYWHKYPIGNELDHIRTKELIEKGFKILRLWESEIKIMNKEDLRIKIQKIGGRLNDF